MMNILLIMCDGLPPHFVGCYGDSVTRTPNIDALAEEGVLFEKAYCNYPLCTPSRASIMTGEYASSLNCFDNADSFDSDWPTLGHLLGRAGYETVICGKMHFLGHDQYHGFDHRLALHTDYSSHYDPSDFRIAYDWDSPSGGNPAGTGWMGESYVKLKNWDDYRYHYDRDEAIHREALSYLSNKTDSSPPFFCCVSFHTPHNPFWIPGRFRKPFAKVELPLPCRYDTNDTCQGPMDRWLNDFHYVPEFGDAMMEQDNLRWLYATFYGMICYLDGKIGEIVDILERQNLRNNTAVIFTSDHGDMLGHRGMLQKRYFYDRSTRVPLIFSFPGTWRQGERVSTLTSLIDLFPTFSEMTRSRLPREMPGTSLLACVGGDKTLGERTIFCEYHGEGVHAPCFMARRGNFKYIYVHGHEERLYNLVDDPDEMVNLANWTAHNSVRKELKQELLTYFDPGRIAEMAVRGQKNRQYVYNWYLHHGKGILIS